ncbi:class F sortase [Streptomyces canus]
MATAALAAVLTLGGAPSEHASPPRRFRHPHSGTGRRTRHALPRHRGTAESPTPGSTPAPSPARSGARRGPGRPCPASGRDGSGRHGRTGRSGRAGWYRFGPAPGSSHGSSVLVGHVDSDTGALGEFAALYDVEPGDTVEVRRAHAEPALYRVTARSTEPKGDLPSATFRRSGPPILTLVTCAPPFLPEKGGYQADLIVTAEPLAA